jgi:hypothetical protein
MDGMGARGFMRQPTALGFAIDGNSLLSALPDLAREVRVEVGGEGGFEGSGVEAAEEALESGDVGSMGGRKAKGAFDGIRLLSAPFGDGEEGAMVGEDGGDGKREDGGKGVAGALTASWVGKEGEGSLEMRSGKGNAGVGSCGEVGGIGRLSRSKL